MSSDHLVCVCVFQGGKSEIFVDVIERMTVVLGSNVSNISVRRTVTPKKLKKFQTHNK